jgi:hypothetical protein
MILQALLTWPQGLTLLDLFLAVCSKVRDMFIKILILYIVVHSMPGAM